jgi:hypothetical protein
VIPQVVDKFMGCGNFAHGFARVRDDEARLTGQIIELVSV